MKPKPWFWGYRTKLLTATWWQQILLRFVLNVPTHTHLIIVSGIPQKPTKGDRVGDAAEVDE